MGNQVHIQNDGELDAMLSEPYPELDGLMRRLDGDLMILGIAGKMGITMGMAAVKAARRAGVEKKVYGVSRFSDPASMRQLNEAGVQTISCDLLSRESVGKLPLVKNVVFMAGRKFGTGGQEEQTWAHNVIVPANVGEHFKGSRIAAFSTGCVYPFVPETHAGCLEEETPSPVGEYAQSCLGRERVFQYYSSAHGTPVTLIRLSYACELRYGVLHDIGHKVWKNQPVDLGVSHFNAIWQNDANHQALLALELCASPAKILNISGLEPFAVKDVAEEFARIMKKNVQFSGAPSHKNYLINTQQATRLFGRPHVSIEQVIQMTADWIMADGRSLNKPTHFEVNNGSY